MRTTAARTAPSRRGGVARIFPDCEGVELTHHEPTYLTYRAICDYGTRDVEGFWVFLVCACLS
jgi:hypothetical protein